MKNVRRGAGWTVAGAMMMALFVSDLTPARAESAAGTGLQELFGETLINSARKRSPTAELAGKRVAIYFSAGWCPPCRAFTPVLAEAYKTWKNDEVPIEVVFVSSDRSVADMTQYMRGSRMPWLAVPFGSEQIPALKQKFRVRGIPMLVVIDAEGKTITSNGRQDVSQHGSAAISRW